MTQLQEFESHTMPSANDIARFLIQVASEEVEPECLTPLRLQKLLYYVQGWSLAKRNAPAFNARIEAWVNGPAVKSVYAEFAGYTRAPITEAARPAPISPQDRYFIRCVWEAYKQFSATKLWEKTHAEPPWREARGDLPGTEPSDAPLDLGRMQRFFTSETRDRIDFDPQRQPDWQSRFGDDFVNAAQAVLAKHSEIMRRLAR